jgi:hypothetical protein
MAKRDPATGKQPDSSWRKKEKARNAAGLPPVKHPAVSREPNIRPDGSPDSGPPHVEIDLEVLYNIALTHASYAHMAHMLGCSDDTLKRNKRYEDVIQKARAEKKKDLLAAQFTAAINDRNPTMLIWMGKQFLEVTRLGITKGFLRARVGLRVIRGHVVYAP